MVRAKEAAILLDSSAEPHILRLSTKEGLLCGQGGEIVQSSFEVFLLDEGIRPIIVHEFAV